MKLSRSRAKAAQPTLEAAFKLVDEGMAKIVADIVATRPLKPAKSRRPRTPRPVAHAA
jgi:hypothetical protein